MAAIALTDTSYLLTTDDLKAVADERLIIEAGDDSKTPQSVSKSFDELDVEVGTVKAQIVEVLSNVVKDAEAEVNGYGRGIYNIPYLPLDPFIKTLVRDWFWYLLRKRRGMFRSEEDAQVLERNLIARGKLIRDQSMVLTSVLIAEGAGANEMMFDWGGADRVSRRDEITFTGDRKLVG